MEINKLVSALSQNGRRLEKLEKAIERAKNRMSFYKGAAIVGFALAGLFALLWLQARQPQRENQQ